MTQPKETAITTYTDIPVDAIRELLDLPAATLQDTWKSLLHTYVRNQHPFPAYVLSQSFLADSTPAQTDLLSGLTIGQQGILYEFSLAYTDPESRASNGQYFTPDDVAIFMANLSSGLPDSHTAVWLDPCCGVGNLSYHLADKQEDPQEFVKDRLVLQDLDPLALNIASVLLSTQFTTDDPTTYTSLLSRSRVQDFLDVSKTLPDYDYVIVNPPYAVVPKNSDFPYTKDSKNLYAYFLERILTNSHQAKGFISITPQSYTDGEKFQGLRDLLKNSQPNKGFDIYSFDNMPDTIFRGVKFGTTNTNKKNSTRASVIVYGKTSERRITPLLRWTVEDRPTILQRADEFLTELPEADIFPKVSAALSTLYSYTKSAPTLSTYLSKTPTPYCLTVPSSPRYFIPAVRRDLNRTSSKTLYFHTQQDLDLLYPYLNSSILYWWWRVCDDGMMLSTSTLNSLPVPPTLTTQPDLISMLETSEKTNLVVKMNAGKPSENVKHPTQIIQTLNSTYFPTYADALMLEHTNSSLLTL